MPLSFLLKGGLALCLVVIHSIAADSSGTIDEIREQIDSLGVRSIQSAGGHIVVSGPDPLGNAALLSIAEDTGSALENLTGLALPFDGQSLRITVLPAGSEHPRNPVSLTHSRITGIWIHRVTLSDYEEMASDEAALVLCKALLSVYSGTVMHREHVFPLPLWLLYGVVRNLTVASRQETLDAALLLWREGRLATPVRILQWTEFPDDELLGEVDWIACGAFVQWFSSFPERGLRYRLFFELLAKDRQVDLKWMESWLGEGADSGEQWDRWLLAQRELVRGVGTVSLEQFDLLYAEWLIYPGRYGIPHDVNLPVRADCSLLIRFRGQHWFLPVLREKRYRIEMLAAGRPAFFQSLIGDFVKVLDAVEAGAPPVEVRGLSSAAGRRWNKLRENVRKAGGVLGDL